MRVAVLSDIHGNLYALETALEAIEGERVDEIWCLGDLVGYGPRPNEVVEATRGRTRICLAGNHDLAVVEGDFDEFSDDAAAAARWTVEVLAPEARSFLESLEPAAAAAGVELFHGSPRDPVWDYVLTVEGALDALLRTEEPVVLVGHSHVALAIGLDGDALDGGLAPADHEVDLARGRWLLNPGSVGQPRDGDPRASFLVLDFDERCARFRRVAYAVERTQAEIRERNLPEALAERLAHGV